MESFDIVEDFRFQGCIIGVNGQPDRAETRLPNETSLGFVVPFRWITHEVSFEGQRPPYKRTLIPLPTWDAGEAPLEDVHAGS